MPRTPTQAEIERAWRIRLLARGVNMSGATESERRAAAKRNAALAEQAREAGQRD